MRPIKFRAWNIPRKAWFTLDGTDHFDIFEDEHFVVEQFTGVHDKNGKEIYEGDIVRFGQKPCLVTVDGVEWSFGDYQLRNKDASDLEVIGNIHENPDILIKDSDA